jgi:serine protease Do
MKKLCQQTLIIIVLAIAIGDSLLSAVAFSPTKKTKSPPSSHSFSLTINHQALATNPQEIARQITVRIITNPGTGSGVIISRQGQKYTVLTNNHVVADTWDSQYKLLTSDGITHPAQRINSPQFANLDLAIVQFTSSQNYRVAEIDKSNNLLLGQPVYAAGFPNWHWVDPHKPVSTRELGLKALKITTGTLEMLSKLPLFTGYQLGYTNDVENGMSGGPVLNEQGHLIGINGRLKHPFDGIDAYVFTDGSQPSQEEFMKMSTLSWAIPIATVKGLNLFFQ